MQTFKLLDAKGYIVFELEGQGILVDTGSPITFAVPGYAAEICGIRCEASSGLMASLAQMAGMAPNMDKLSQETGTSIAMLLGNDNLSKLKMLTNVPKGEISFDTRDIPCAGNEISLENMMNYLLAPIRICNTDCRVFIDTGAPVSYVQGKYIVPSLCTDGIDREDFSPIYGKIKSHTRMVPATFANTAMQLECAPMSGSLETQVSLVRADGVIGGAIFGEHQVYMDISKSILKIV